MPDILLIQPPIRDYYLTAKRTIPYGLASIAASLEASGFTVDIFDALATGRSRIIERPREMDFLDPYYGRPDRSPFCLFHHYRHYGYGFDSIGRAAAESGAFLVGISSLFTPYSAEAIKAAETVKAFHPGCRIVLGGHHPTAFPEEVMSCPAVDFVIRGEGEEAIPALARALRSGAGIEEVAGIVFRKPAGGYHIDPPAVVEDLDRIPGPALHLVRHSHYRRGEKNSMVVAASRGCPMKCSYCAVGASAISYRRRSVESVLSEMEEGVLRHRVGFVDFEDENLSLDRSWFLRLLGEIRARFGASGMELRAMNGLLPASLDEEVIVAMKGAGFKTLNLSLGSGSAEQLRRFNRPDVRKSFENACRIARDHGLEAVGYVIAGAPDQDAKDSVADLLYLARNRALAGMSIFYPAPASPDYQRCKTLGILPPSFSLMRSSALPVSHLTGRTEAATLLRLARILNFIKALGDGGDKLPVPEPFPGLVCLEPSDRMETGKRLLSWFLHDGRIRGVSPDGEIYAHEASLHLTRLFIRGLADMGLAGPTTPQ